jgi:hypothetical protein|tara:strand:- start:41 stop:232 length:192 start_codon:yes stop_codon:yes gene_type:complete
MKMTLKQKKKLKRARSKVDLQNNIAHLGSKLMSGNIVNGLINLEDKNRLHLLDEILLIRGLTK